VKKIEMEAYVPHPEDWPEGVEAIFLNGKVITRQEAYKMLGGAPRDRLKPIIERICEANLKRIHHPKNVAKGDNWDELSNHVYRRRTAQECDEFFDEFLGEFFDEEDAYAEAGDVVAFLAMRIDTQNMSEEQ
jgi:hypothetical protein